MNVLDVVRREARRRGSSRGAASGFAPDAWKHAEQALLSEVRTTPRGASRLVDAFARTAAAAANPEALGRAARLRGSWLSYVGRDREALPAYRDAVRRLDGQARDGARLGLAGALLRVGRFADARKVCRALRRTAERRNDTVLAAMARTNEGTAWLEGGNARASVPHLEFAVLAYRAAGRRAQEAAAAQILGNALVLLDRYDEATALFDAAGTAYTEAGLTHEATRCRMTRALVLVATERLGEADAELRRCEAAFRAADDPLHAALSRRDRGEALLRAGLVPEARHALATAARALAAGAPPVERARTALLSARAALLAGDPDSALRHLRSPHVKEFDRAESMEIFGRAAAMRGSTADAESAFRLAVRAFGSRQPVGRARCLTSLAWTAHARGDLAEARRRAALAERTAESLPVPSLRFAASAVRFLAESAAGRRGPADAALERAGLALESVRAGLGPETMRSALLRGRDVWLATAVRHILDGEDGPRRALTFLERWRARSLVDLLAETAAGDTSVRVASLRRAVAAMERRAEHAPTTGFLRAPLDAGPLLLRRLRAAERELLAALEREPSVAARAFSTDDLDAVRASLPAGTLVVAPIDDGDRTTLFVLDRSGVRTVTSAATPAAVAAATTSVHHALGAWTLGPSYVARHETRLRRAVDAALAELAAALLVPIAAELAATRRLLVVPHGPWHHVPFAALPWEGRPLIDGMTVAVLPALAALRDAPAIATGGSVVVASPDAAAPAARVEAERVAAVLGASLFADDAASSDVLLALDRPACLHVAAHGRHRADAPAASGVRLADGWFRAAEFARLRLSGSTVVLSGCETGMSAVDAGDESHGLVRGVLAAGASDVVSSLWRIDDTATARFMERLHALRATGSPLESALAAVQREHAAAGAPPWHWAGFVHHARRV